MSERKLVFKKNESQFYYKGKFELVIFLNQVNSFFMLVFFIILIIKY
jgi:hypothetical protein